MTLSGSLSNAMNERIKEKMSAKTPEQAEATFSFLLGEYNRGSIDAGALWGNVKSQIIEQHTDSAVKEARYSYALKGADAVLQDVIDYIDANNPSISTLRQHLPTMAGHIYMKELEIEPQERKAL